MFYEYVSITTSNGKFMMNKESIRMWLWVIYEYEGRRKIKKKSSCVTGFHGITSVSRVETERIYKTLNFSRKSVTCLVTIFNVSGIDDG